MIFAVFEVQYPTRREKNEYIYKYNIHIIYIIYAYNIYNIYIYIYIYIYIHYIEREGKNRRD